MATQSRKRLLNSSMEYPLRIQFAVDGATISAGEEELLVGAINRALPQRHLAQVCYHRAMGPIETCDTCTVEMDGTLCRACATPATAGSTVVTASRRAVAAQTEAFDRILKNHGLYCTVSDNNNGNCTLRNLLVAGKLLGSLDPERSASLSSDLPKTIQSHGEKQQPPTLWEIFKRIRRPEVRRGLSLLTSVLAALGRGANHGPRPKAEL